jgi:uncharacterized damage-inducible protein DinB
MNDLVHELNQEAATTRRVLERVPEDQLAWKPHAKSMSLGQLALHTAQTPGMIAGMLAGDTLAVPPDAFQVAQPASRREILDAHTGSVAAAATFLEGLTPQKSAAIWHLSAGGKEVMAAPRGGVVRALLLNHWYHHRGQLSVYLRLLDVPLPSIYGPSADENPFT